MWILSTVLAYCGAFDAYNFVVASTFLFFVKSVQPCSIQLLKLKIMNGLRCLNVNTGPLFAVTKEKVSISKTLAELSSVTCIFVLPRIRRNDAGTQNLAEFWTIQTTSITSRAYKKDKLPIYTSWSNTRQRRYRSSHSHPQLSMEVSGDPRARTALTRKKDPQEWVGPRHCRLLYHEP